ncbi:hypothetical protein ONS95_009587 [Cadophora gregata]|uniref:uncharacterized protein n=1 Tax=Cadophora gregata TaxID=51156 RepID=UPI0026DBC6EA|nr:uncharacterized protein ONS95_009587 [Cadophora gregata]KAK0124640.1 hypothetical protein ONS95_009587 [Cadophora gregata]KAK0129502.1 hypothetical protein ONS96_000068 [Cadophora gregata f. sp. sojae]
METPSSPASFNDTLSQDETAPSPANDEKKPGFESALVNSLQRQVAKLRNDLKTSNTQLSLVRQQKTKATDQLKAIDQRYEKKIKNLEKEAAEQKRNAEQNLQLAKKIQDWNDEQSKQCSALMQKNEKCISDKFELQLQIEAMDCMLNNITPDMVRKSTYKTHPLSWYTDCMAVWRVNLAKVEGKCKALEAALENEKKTHNKELSSLILKGEIERQNVVGNVLIGLFKVSGLNDEETVNRIAKAHGPGTESTEVRQKMIKLLEDILAEASRDSKSGSDPMAMYAALSKEVKGLPVVEKMAPYATPTHRLLVGGKTASQPMTSPNVNDNAPSTTKDIPKPADNTVKTITIKKTALAPRDTSTTPTPEVSRPATRRPPIATKSSLREELPSADSQRSHNIPLKDSSRPKTIAGKAKSAVSWAVKSTLNTLRDDNKEEIKNALTDPRDAQIQRLLDQYKKCAAALKASISDTTELDKQLRQFQEVHCTNFPSKCTHMPWDTVDIIHTPCPRRDCINRVTEATQQEQIVEQLQEYINVIAPMATIGSAVRIQFLEEARAALEGDEPNECIILEGILAARGANGEVDNNLFAGSDTLDEHPLFQIFEKIYEAQSREDWEDLPELLKRTIDCQATIRFAKNLPATTEMMVLLQGHDELCERLVGRFKKWVDGKTEMFEANVNHWFLLDRLEWLTDEILMFEEEKSVDRFLEYIDKDGNNPKVRVKRWAEAEEDFHSPDFGFIATVEVGTLPADRSSS